MDRPTIFLRTNETKLWWIVCHSPRFELGPFPSEGTAFAIRDAIESMFDAGQKSIQEPMRELLGLSDVDD